MRPGQSAVSFSPDDTIIGVKNPGSLGGGGFTVVVKDNYIYGTDPDAIAEALKNKLYNMISS